MADSLTLTLPARPDHPKWDDRDNILKEYEKMSVEAEIFKYDIYEALENGDLNTRDLAEALNYAEGAKRHATQATRDERRKIIYLNAYFKGYSDALAEMQASSPEA